MIQVSVIIPTYQRCAALARLLPSLCHQTLAPASYEVIVVVDGSTDNTRQWVERFAAPYALECVWQNNRGRAAACNAGIANAQGDLLVLLDDDMVATPGLLAGHVAMHKGLSPLAVVGAAPIQATTSDPPLVRWMAEAFAHRLTRFAQPGYQLLYHEAYSGNFSIRRALMQQVGGFDENFKFYGYEDYELALRLTQAGVQLAYSADALAHQHYEKRFAELTRDTLARGRSALLFAGKHPEVIAQLKLGAADQASWKWRLLRTFLLTLTRRWATTPNRVVHLVEQLEERAPAHLPLVYALALDYFYWVGVYAALGEQLIKGSDTQAWQTLANRVTV